MTDEPTLSRNDDECRYELRLGDELIGRIDYRLSDGIIDMRHTEVDPGHGGQGFGERLVVFALDDARAAGLKVKPTCPYIHRYMDKHPELESLRA